VAVLEVAAEDSVVDLEAEVDLDVAALEVVVELPIEVVGVAVVATAIEVAGDIDAPGDVDGGAMDAVIGDGAGPIGDHMDIMATHTDVTILTVMIATNVTHIDIAIMTRHTGGATNKCGPQNKLLLSLKKKRLLTIEGKNIGKYLIQQIAS